MADKLPPPLPIERFDSTETPKMVRKLASAVFDTIGENPDPMDRLKVSMSAAIFLCGFVAGAYEMAHPGIRKPKASEMMRMLADRIEHEEQAMEAGVAPYPSDRPN